MTDRDLLESLTAPSDGPRRRKPTAWRVGLIALAVFLVGGVAIGSAVWLGWGTTPRPGSGADVHLSTTTPPGLVLGSDGSGHRAVADSLTGVWCGKHDACIAVGNDARRRSTVPLSEMRTASSPIWSVVRTPAIPNATLEQLVAVSCAGSSPSWCVAVGTVLSPVRSSVAEMFDGSWHLLPTPDFGEGDSLSGVTCTGRGDCIAVGSTQLGGRERTLIERLRGGTWSVMTSASVAGPAALASIACDGNCVAVGALVRAGREEPLAEVLAGGSWRVVATPLPGGSPGGGLLSSVSCAGSGSGSGGRGQAPACAAVGVRYVRSGAGEPLVEVEPNGSDGSWSPVRPVDAGRAQTSGTLLGVSCSSRTSCTAVGSRRSSDAKAASSQPFAVTESDGEWLLGNRPAVSSPAASLSGVSCAYGSPCEAVGSALARPGGIATLVVLIGSGVTAMQTSPSPGL